VCLSNEKQRPLLQAVKFKIHTVARTPSQAVSAEIPEAAKFQRQRSRSRLGWEFEQQYGF